MNFKKQFALPICIALGMSLLSACGGNDSNRAQDNGNATGTIPEGDINTPETFDSTTMRTDTMPMDTNR